MGLTPEKGMKMKQRKSLIWIAGNMLALFSVLAGPVHAADLEQLADRLLIQEVQNRYALAHDLTDPAMYASVFAEDAELVSGGNVLAKGRDAMYAIGESDRKRFNAGAQPNERSFGVMRHVVTNSVIDITSDTTATAFCYVLTVVNEEGVGPQIMSVGRYEDEFAKVNGQWLISRRLIAMDMGNQELAKVILGP
jgi:hypothetical protein